MADEERRAKRSRFDQTDPDPRRPSRFDRRSRSPTSRHPDSTRQRSPLSREPLSPAADASGRSSAAPDPTAAAGKKVSKAKSDSWMRVCVVDKYSDSSADWRVFLAAAAARINAQLQAKKVIQHADVPPVRSVRTWYASERSPQLHILTIPPL